MMKIKLIFLLLTAVAMMAPGVQCQQGRLTPAQIKQMHHEVPDDAYLPNAFGNGRTTPGYRYSLMKSGSQQSSIMTVQVNVNADGRNIAGDAANEPSIAVNPWHPEVMTIGWRQFDNVSSNFRQAGWGYTTDGGHSWTFPGVIEAGKFRSDPVLDFDAEGNFYYNSLTNDPDYFCKVFRSNTGGATWDPGTDAKGGDKQWMAIDRSYQAGHGNIYAFWSYYFSTCSPGFFTRSTDGNVSYEDCTQVDGNPYWGTLAVGNEGELYIAGTDGTPDSLVVVKSVNAREKDSVVTWRRSSKVYFGGSPTGWGGVNPGGLLGQVNIDVDHSNGPGRDNVYVLAPVYRYSNNDPCDVMFIRSEDGGITWSSPVRVNDDVSTTNSQWFGTMSVAPDGRIDAIWLDTRDAPAGSDSSALYYSFSTDQGVTWSKNEKMSPLFDPHVGYPNQNKMGDYLDMSSDSTGAHLAWANTLNGEQDVYYSRIIPYVNATGIDELAGATYIRIFPNPVGHTLIITGLTPDSKIEVSTILGKKVFSQTASRETCEIDMSVQPEGIYFVRVIDRQGRMAVRKIARQ
jgi:hypothetical protein